MTPDQLRAEIVRLCRERWPEFCGLMLRPEFMYRPNGSVECSCECVVYTPRDGSPHNSTLDEMAYGDSETETLTRLLEKVRERVGSEDA